MKGGLACISCVQAFFAVTKPAFFSSALVDKNVVSVPTTCDMFACI